jgi:hypothetical protein
MANDNMDSLCPQLASRIEHARNHGFPPNLVEYLW